MYIQVCYKDSPAVSELGAASELFLRSSPLLPFYWVAVKALKLSYSKKETPLTATQFNPKDVKGCPCSEKSTLAGLGFRVSGLMDKIPHAA